jgi:tRNA 5-methylaminomethyl-2-thiouridine biosynthesis bifunctional protein
MAQGLMSSKPSPAELSPVDTSPVVWADDGSPRSRRFDDVYFSSADGLAESRAVFLQGCGLPEAWRGRARFCVGELGFGSGLNVLALLDLWARTREPGARLRIFSIEAYPMPAADAARALAAWPELAGLAARLTGQWPRPTPGFHRLALDDLGAVVDLAVMDAADALQAWSGKADAWFLDGFSPALNPGMWSQTVLDGVAARSAAGARAATFTVAGAVRRGLQSAGFAIEKRPGFGRKRERLEARLPAAPPEAATPAPRVAIVGAGVAGAALARAFASLGVAPLVVEAASPGAAASGNPAALVMPRLDAGGGAVARLYAQAFGRAVDVYDQRPPQIIDRGAVQAENGPKDASRFDRIAVGGLFAPHTVERLSPEALSARLGEPVAAAGLAFAEARVVEPAMVLAGWLAGVEVRQAVVARIDRACGRWRLFDADGGLIEAADILCLAAATDCARLTPQAPLAPVRGQISAAASAERPGAALWGGYVIAARQGLVFGATHDRDDVSRDVRAGDHVRNLELLGQARPRLAARLAGAPLEGRAAVRAVTPDFLPLAGPVPVSAEDPADMPGLFMLSGLGSRGFCAAPLLAEHVAAMALGAPSPLPSDLAAIVHPARFVLRRIRRQRGQGGMMTAALMADEAGEQDSEAT